MTESLISLVVPVYDEAETIGPLLRGLEGSLGDHPHEILITYDRDEDTTLPAVEAMEDRPPSVRLVKNDRGPGVAYALQEAFAAARGDVVVVTMADLSDDPAVIPAMVEKARAGAAVVSGSRYGEGGEQLGGPLLKRTLSRIAGVSLHYIAGVDTRDSTTNFRAYRTDFLRSVEIESRRGFEVALELTVKAHLAGRKVDEVPTTWRDRSAGTSRFRIWKWLPGYLRWYLRATAAPLFVWTVLLALGITLVSLGIYYNTPIPCWDEMAHIPYVTGDRPVTLEWIWDQHNEHRIPLPKIVYVTFMKTFALDGRPLRILNGLAMVLMAALGVLAARRIRGRTLFADAFFPLLFLHGGHLENTIWPFQFSIILPGLLMFLMTMLIVHYREEKGGIAALLGGLCIVGLSLSSGVGLPPALILAPWVVRVGIKDRQPAGIAGVILALVGIALVGLYFVGYQSPMHHPESPGVGASLLEGWKCLSTSMGSAGARIWPGSGMGILILIIFIASLLQISWWRDRGDRIRSGGLILVLASVVAIAIGVGHFRTGFQADVGFAGRYTAFTCLLLCVACLSCEIHSPRGAAPFVRTVLVALLWALLWPNTQRGIDHGDTFRYTSKLLRRDVRAGRPVEEIARLHWPSWYPEERQFAEYLRMMGRARMAVYRHRRPPEATENPPVSSSMVFLEKGSPDTGKGIVLEGGVLGTYAHPPSRAVLPVPGGTRTIEISYGLQGGGPSDGVEFRVILEGGDGKEHPLWSAFLSDGGIRKASMIIPGGIPGPHRIFLETGVGPRGDPAYDWAYWGVVRFLTE